jgi:hypothetical protein
MKAPNAQRTLLTLALAVHTTLASTLFLGVAAVPTPAQARETSGNPQLGLPRTTIRAGMFNIDAQVASNRKPEPQG